METLEERVAYLEGKMEDHILGFVSLRDSIGRLEHRVDALADRMDARFENVERRFEAVDRRFEAIDHRFELLDDKMSRHFLWLAGIQVTTLIGVVGALLSRA
jgi:hypothetical protein